MTISYSKLFVGISLPTLCTGLAGLILCSAAHAQPIRPSTQKELKVFDPTSATGNVGIRAAAGTVSYTLTLPAAAPSVNQVLSANAVSGGTVSLTWATPFSGTGTNNYLSKFASAGTLTNSQVFDNGTYVGIGTATPSYKLDVNGGSIGVNTSGQTRTISTFYGANSEGVNIFIGGGGNSSVGEVDQTYKGAYNTSVGVNALLSNTTGYNNSAMGSQALYNNTTGYNNSAIGVNALVYNTTGYNNTGLGYGAGISPTHEVGSKRITDDYDMTLIGYGATKNSASQLNNSIAIGVGTLVTTSNTAMWGNASMTRHVFQAGNVGIGTTNPNYKLEIKHNNTAGVGIDITNSAAEGYYAILENGVNGGGLEYFGGLWGSPIFQNAVSLTSWKNNVGKIVFITNTSNSTAARMLITNGGNVGIGTTDPGNDKLQINESSDADLNVGIVARGGNSRRAQLTFGVKNSGGTTVGGSIGSSGTRGGGLVLQGNTGSISDGAAHLFISAGGDISAGMLTGSSDRQLYVTSGGVLTTSSSDARLKTNIEVIPNALQKVMGLRGVTYNWKDGRDTTRVLGMIAQEMLKVAPELVFQNNNGYYGIHYAETTGLLVEAIKEQQKVIEQLKAEQTTTSSLLRQLQLDLQAIRKQNAVHKE